MDKNTKATQLEIKIQCTVRIKTLLKNNIYVAHKSIGRPPKFSKKSEKKLINDVLKDHKTSLERIRVAHNAFSCYDTISRDTVRRIFKNLMFFQEMMQKSKFEEEKQVRISSDGIVRVFQRNGTRFLGRNTKNLSSDKRSLMF